MESAQAQDTSHVAELEAQRAAGEELRAQVCLACTRHALAMDLTPLSLSERSLLHTYHVLIHCTGVGVGG